MLGRREVEPVGRRQAVATGSRAQLEAVVVLVLAADVLPGVQVGQKRVEVERAEGELYEAVLNPIVVHNRLIYLVSDRGTVRTEVQSPELDR